MKLHIMALESEGIAGKGQKVCFWPKNGDLPVYSVAKSVDSVAESACFEAKSA
jgi:hypothetical protein